MLAFALLLLATTASAGTVDNDDSCDIAVLPAATLLLPYFEVDFNTPATTAKTTIVTIQNTSAMPQIARVTLWTDWAYPMLTFNLFLTGYDVQALNLRDIFARGLVAPGGAGGTSNTTRPGDLSLANDQNPHFLADAAATCSNNPGTLDAALLKELQTAFTTGTVTRPNCSVVKPVGAIHTNAIGYATIDVVGNCSPTSPADAAYFTREILFDNVLTGDYQHINPNPATGNYAGGNPLVHIRAVPEGGPAGAVVPTRLPYTFYDLYTRGAAARTQDRRQPLPSAFMPRFIQGGTGAFNTNFQIWRESTVTPTSCPTNQSQNSYVKIEEEVRFDEHENPTYWDYNCIEYGSCYPGAPPASAVSTTAGLFPSPFSASADVGGWMFLNLNNGGSSLYSAARDYRVGTTRSGPRQSQAWVVTSMFAEGRYATETDAAAVGNGCSVAPDETYDVPIGPAPNAAPAAPRGMAATLRPTTIDNDDSCDIAVLPAATLLLPYFEVDINSPQTVARTTLFTIQNTTAMPQIARVTLWTDWSYPMLTFNLFLTGYDLQGINLYDIFARSKVAPTLNPSPGGTSNETPPGEISLANDKNPHFLPDAAATCRSNPGFLGDALLADLKAAFVKGTVTAPNCAIVKPVGGVHANAVGYATIDVVGNCNPTSPLTTRYFGELLYDNVLTGDYQHINPNPATGNYAGANPLVHIRAVPEGGPAGIFVPTPLPYTFYDLYTTGLLWRTMDRRQPLPSAFLPRLIQGGTSAFNTNLEIWREARAAPTLCPLDYTSNAVVPIAEIVRFDEHENATYPVCIEPCPSPGFPALPSVSNGASFFPSPSTSGDVGGWLFLNLNNFGSPAYSAARNYRFGTTLNGPRQSQAWVVTNMFAEGRYAVEMDAAAVGNGCSPAPGFSPYTAIGPAPNPNP